MMRLVIAAAAMSVAVASSAQSQDTLADTYRKALEVARQQAAAQKSQSDLAASFERSGFLTGDAHDHDEVNPAVWTAWTILSKNGAAYGAAQLGVTRYANDEVTVYLTGHPLFSGVELGDFTGPDEFNAKTGGAASIKAFADDLVKNYPYVDSIPAFVDAKTRAKMTAAMAAARERARQEQALCNDLYDLGLTLVYDREHGVTWAKKDGVTVTMTDSGVNGVSLTVSVDHSPLPKGPLASYGSIAEFREKTGALTQIHQLIAAAAKD